MKQLFMGRLFREKILLLGFALLVLATWGVSVGGRAKLCWSEARGLMAERTRQDVWLSNAATITTKAKAATQILDIQSTLTATQLVGELNRIAAQVGLAADINAQSTQRTDRFAFNIVQVGFRRVDLGALLRFYEELAKRSPYIALEQFSLTTDRAAPGLLNASFRAVAVELSR